MRRWITRVLLPLTIGVLVFVLLPLEYQLKLAMIPLAIGREVTFDYGDVIIVPGGGCNPGCGTEERINLAAELYHQKRRNVIVSEGHCFPFEVENFKARMIHQWGIAEEDIYWDTLSKTSVENVINSQNWADSLGWSEAIVCTSPHHQLRFAVIMSKLWSEDFQMAKMDAKHWEFDHYPVYRERRGETIRSEYLKTLHHLIFL